jgi:hypothetical protein
MDDDDMTMGDDDVTMGDIDVRRTLSELEERGLVERDDKGYGVNISLDRYTEVMESYIQNCLLSDIDRDFYLQVAEDVSLERYIGEYLIPSIDTDQPEDVPITMMRLVVEGQGKAIYKVLEWTGTISYFTVNINL